MWNSALTGVKVQNESSVATSFFQLRDQWTQHDKRSMLKYYFEEWKKFAMDKPTNKATVRNPRKKKETANTKIVQRKTISHCSWNCIDLNQILLQNEVDLLRKFWGFWKDAVKKNKSLLKANIKAKGKCFQKPHQVINQSLSGAHRTITNELVKSKNCDTMKKYFNLWKDKTRLPSTAAALESNVNHWGCSEKMKALDMMSILDSKSTYEVNTDISILRDYLNVWRVAKNSSHSAKNHDMPTNKIETFLTAVKAAKMKTTKKIKSNHSILHGSHPKRMKSHRSDTLEINHQNERDQAWNKNQLITNQPPLKVNVNEIIDSREDMSSKIISSIKKEVNVSLEEAQSLLESTIAVSYRGNCARRKAFNKRNRKGSPLPPEMPADDIVNRMRTRELERAARWQNNKERRERLENERVTKIIEEEKEKLRQQELSKKLKVHELREQKMEKILREKYLEEVRQKYHQLNLKALKHYNEKLLQKALQSFMNEVSSTAELESQACTYHEKMLLLRIFIDWKDVTCLNCEGRISTAVQFHQKILLRSCFTIFLRLQREYILNKQAATDFCEMRTQEKAFLRWNQYTCDMMIEMNLKVEIADIFYKRCLLKRNLLCWKRLPSVMGSERVRERIKNNFRMKVLEIFPDFNPHIEDDSYPF